MIFGYFSCFEIEYSTCLTYNGYRKDITQG